jgi:hypothetical protein
VITGTDRNYCLQHVQTDSRANVVSSPMGTGVITQGVEWTGHKADTYAHLGPRLGMCGTVTAFLCVSSWHDVN